MDCCPASVEGRFVIPASLPRFKIGVPAMALLAVGGAVTMRQNSMGQDEQYCKEFARLLVHIDYEQFQL